MRGSADITSATRVNRSTSAQSDSVTPLVLDDDGGAVRPLAEQVQHAGHGVVRRDDDRRLDDGVLRLHVGDHAGHDVGRDVLRDDRDAAAPRDGLRHAAARHGGHVGDDDGDGGAGAVVGREVDVEPRRDVRARRHEEDVAVGEVGGGALLGEESHVHQQ
jgi:hypothetical protein